MRSHEAPAGRSASLLRITLTCPALSSWQARRPSAPEPVQLTHRSVEDSPRWAVPVTPWAVSLVPWARESCDMVGRSPSRPATPRQLDVLAAYVAAACRHGLALAPPDAVVARLTGVGHADAINIRIPIDGAEWRRSSESA